MNDDKPIEIQPVPSPSLSKTALSAFLDESFIGVDGILVGTTVTLSEQYVWNIIGIYISASSSTTLEINWGQRISMPLPAGFWHIWFSVPIVIPNMRTTISLSTGTLMVVARKT